MLPFGSAQKLTLDQAVDEALAKNPLLLHAGPGPEECANRG